MPAGDAADIFGLLEGGADSSRAVFDAFAQLFSSVREPWLTRALLMYHARTGSARAVELLARLPEPHARHLLDALQDALRGERQARHQALGALAPLVARRPPWLDRLAAPHPLVRELVRAARSEREPLPLLHALLALAMLIPTAPALAGPHCPELTDALLRPSGLELAPATRLHLRLAQLALFRALYATHPCSLVEALRAELAARPAGWEEDVARLLGSVRLHAGLLTGSRQREADISRWARLEPHDVLDECRRLSAHDTRLLRADQCPLPVSPPPEGRASTPAPKPSTPTSKPSTPAPKPPSRQSRYSLTGAPPVGSVEYFTRAMDSMRPGGEGWFSLSEAVGGESAPATPLPEPEAEPEAAVEATPENTPARESRPVFRFPVDSATVRAIGRVSSPPDVADVSDVADAPDAADVAGVSARLARVALERRGADSPLQFGRAPPAAAARPAPRRPARRAPPRSRRAAPRRAASCSPRLPPRRSRSASTQTLDHWPEPYEFIIADYCRTFPDNKFYDNDAATEPQPCEKLEQYMNEVYAGRATGGELAQLHAQLLFERWRRDSYAERSRRLLGRVRHVRALETQNAQLRDRLRAAERERDAERAAGGQAARAQAAAAAAAGGRRERELEAALAAERAARARAEAALAEALGARAAAEAELGRASADAQETVRYVQSLAKAALAAERRADHIARLRRELLVLGERERRLADAVRAHTAAPPEPGAERALRAALARAEAELDAAMLRGEQAARRAAELEAAAREREAGVLELKRATRHAAELHAARLRATEDKYANMCAIVRSVEFRKLELLAAAERRLPGPVRAAPLPPESPEPPPAGRS